MKGSPTFVTERQRQGGWGHPHKKNRIHRNRPGGRRGEQKTNREFKSPEGTEGISETRLSVATTKKEITR